MSQIRQNTDLLRNALWDQKMVRIKLTQGDPEPIDAAVTKLDTTERLYPQKLHGTVEIKPKDAAPMARLTVSLDLIESVVPLR